MPLDASAPDMNTELLIQTKLQPPRLLPGLIPRPRLLAALNDGLARGLTLISAPAGYGKTTLAAAWLAQLRTMASAWLSLDQNDNEFEVFAQYFLSAIQSAFPGQELCHGKEIAAAPAGSLPVSRQAGLVINNLAALPQPMVFVLDDFHVLQDPQIDEFMEALLQYLPPTLHLVLVTRRDPSYALLARRRAQQRIAEIRAADLRFLTDETRAVLEQTSGMEVNEEAASILETQTEGWIIGLQMAAISMRDREDQLDFARSFERQGHRYVMDFLLNDLLAHQPAGVIEFLLKTSILDGFSAELAAAVIASEGGADADAQDHIRYLDRGNLFVVPLDQQGEWYRYHHLFQMLLQRRLAQELSKSEIERLHARAGRWLAARGSIEPALQHLIAAGDISAAAALIEAHRHEAQNRGEVRKIGRWLRLLPEELIAQRLPLLQLRAWAWRLEADHEAVAKILKQAEAIAAAGDHTLTADEQKLLQAERDAMWAEIHFYQYDFQRALNHAAAALAALPADLAFARGLAAAAQIGAQYTLSGKKPALALAQAGPEEKRPGHHEYRGRVLIATGFVFGASGDLQRLEQTGRALMQIGREEGSRLDVAWGHLFLGRVNYLWNRLEKAHAHWSALRDLLYNAHLRTYQEAVQGIALLQQLQGSTEAAQETMTSLSRVLVEAGHSHLVGEVDSFQARLALLRGDVAQAVHWAKTHAETNAIKFWYWEASDLTRVKVGLAEGTGTSLRQAAAQLDADEAYLSAIHNTDLLIQIKLLRALLAAAEDDTETALAELALALSMAEPGGYIRVFLDAGPGVPALLNQLAVRDGATPYIARILAAANGGTSAVVETLTQRELEILEQLRLGKSNQQIADELVLSVHTVKKHNRNIYQKLAVNGRDDAIAMAQKLGLLQEPVL